MISKFIDEKLKILKCKKWRTREARRSSSQSPLKSRSHPGLQSPHKHLRPYYTSSPINPPTPIIIQYPLSKPSSLPSTSPSTSYEYHPILSFSDPILIPNRNYNIISRNYSLTPVPTPISLSHISISPVLSSTKTIQTRHHISITPKDLDEYFAERFKKGTSYLPKNYIRDILDEDMELSNEILITIIADYNRDKNRITDPDYFISAANRILLEYIDVNDFKTDNIYQAYNFIILGSVVSFWIFYKFMIDDNTININCLQYYLNLNNVNLDRDTILNLEIDILQTIDYNVLKFI